jgi:spermidine/putrescine transport system substrate-binding protein
VPHRLAHSSSSVLNLYIWSEYIPDEVVAAFTRETGIRVNLSTYDSNEAMYAKIKLIGSGYDLVVPSSDYVGLMQREGLLLPVDTTRIANFAHIAPRLPTRSFDPGNQYSIPYMWGSTSIAVHTGMIAAESVQSLADLWQPELKGRLLLPNDPREVMAIGLKVLGYSVNETNPEHLQQAYEKLRTLMPLVRVFDSDSPKQALLSREVAVGVVWNGEAYIANSENQAIEYVYPPEGIQPLARQLLHSQGSGEHRGCPPFHRLHSQTRNLCRNQHSHGLLYPQQGSLFPPCTGDQRQHHRQPRSQRRGPR